MTSTARRSFVTAFALSSLVVISVYGAQGCTSSDDGPVTSSSAALCEEFCTKVSDTCTGDKAMFHDRAECLSTCDALKPQTETATTGNTVKCRLAQVNAGNCNGAGLLGGTVCGNPCDGFCRVAAAACGAKAFPDEQTCLEACDPRNPNTRLKFVDTKVQGVSQPLSGEDTLNCRGQHLLLALKSPDPHCGHIVENSPVCKAANAPQDAGGD